MYIHLRPQTSATVSFFRVAVCTQKSASNPHATQYSSACVEPLALVLSELGGFDES